MLKLPLNDRTLVIAIEKFTEYALNPAKDPYKAMAFESALGYTIENAPLLVKNIKNNVFHYNVVSKGNRGYGELYEVIIQLKGENGKTAKVLTGWIDDIRNGELRLVTVHIDK